MKRGYDDPVLAAEHAAKVEEDARRAATGTLIGYFLARATAGCVFVCVATVTLVVAGVVARFAWDMVRLGWRL